MTGPAAAVTSNPKVFTKVFTIIDLKPPEKSQQLIGNRDAIDAIRAWLAATSKQRGSPLLIVTGPSGVGKTTTIDLLMQELGYTPKRQSIPLLPGVRREGREGSDADEKIDSIQKANREEVLTSLLKYALSPKTIDGKRNAVILDDINGKYNGDSFLSSIVSGFLGQFQTRLSSLAPIVLILSDFVDKSLTKLAKQGRVVKFKSVPAAVIESGLASALRASGFLGTETLPLRLIAETATGDVRQACQTLDFFMKGGNAVDVNDETSSTLARKDQETLALPTVVWSILNLHGATCDMTLLKGFPPRLLADLCWKNAFLLRSNAMGLNSHEKGAKTKSKAGPTKRDIWDVLGQRKKQVDVIPDPDIPVLPDVFSLVDVFSRCSFGLDDDDDTGSNVSTDLLLRGLALQPAPVKSSPSVSTYDLVFSNENERQSLQRQKHDTQFGRARLCYRHPVSLQITPIDPENWGHFNALDYAVFEKPDPKNIILACNRLDVTKKDKERVGNRSIFID